MYVCVYIHICVYVCVYMYMCMYIYIYIYICCICLLLLCHFLLKCYSGGHPPSHIMCNLQPR